MPDYRSCFCEVYAECYVDRLRADLAAARAALEEYRLDALWWKEQADALRRVESAALAYRQSSKDWRHEVGWGELCEALDAAQRAWGEETPSAVDSDTGACEHERESNPRPAATSGDSKVGAGRQGRHTANQQVLTTADAPGSSPDGTAQAGAIPASGTQPDARPQQPPPAREPSEPIEGNCACGNPCGDAYCCEVCARAMPLTPELEAQLIEPNTDACPDCKGRGWTNPGSRACRKCSGTGKAPAPAAEVAVEGDNLYETWSPSDDHGRIHPAPVSERVQAQPKLIDPRPRCIRCDSRWVPPEGVDAGITECHDCRREHFAPAAGGSGDAGYTKSPQPQPPGAPSAVCSNCGGSGHDPGSNFPSNAGCLVCNGTGRTAAGGGDFRPNPDSALYWYVRTGTAEADWRVLKEQLSATEVELRAAEARAAAAEAEIRDIHKLCGRGDHGPDMNARCIRDAIFSWKETIAETEKELKAAEAERDALRKELEDRDLQSKADA